MARRRVRRDGRWIDTFGQARTHDHTQLDQSMEPQALEACSLARGEHRRSSTRSTRGMHGVQGRDIDCEAKRQHSCVETHELGSAQVSVSVSGLVLPCPDPDRAPSVHARTSKIRSLRRPALANTDFHTYSLRSLLIDSKMTGGSTCVSKWTICTIFFYICSVFHLFQSAKK
jgi:hypothetical protein